jgi:hypothetical protein
MKISHRKFIFPSKEGKDEFQYLRKFGVRLSPKREGNSAMRDSLCPRRDTTTTHDLNITENTPLIISKHPFFLNNLLLPSIQSSHNTHLRMKDRETFCDVLSDRKTVEEM